MKELRVTFAPTENQSYRASLTDADGNTLLGFYGLRLSLGALSPNPPNQNPVQYMIHCPESGKPIEGPLSPQLCRVGQQIVDSAVKSARENKTVPLVT